MERVEMNEKTGERGGGNSGRCEKVCCFWEEESINRFTFEALFIFVWISRKCDGLQLSGHKYLDRPIVDITARVSMEGKREREREREREKESERKRKRVRERGSAGMARKYSPRESLKGEGTTNRE